MQRCSKFVATSLPNFLPTNKKNQNEKKTRITSDAGYQRVANLQQRRALPQMQNTHQSFKCNVVPSLSQQPAKLLAIKANKQHQPCHTSAWRIYNSDAAMGQRQTHTSKIRMQ
jgi:hypothetical protein